MKNYTDLRKKYNKTIAEIIKIFEQKQGIEFDFWIADKIGETAVFSDFSFNFSDILFDLDTEQPAGKIIEWFYYTIEHEKIINYNHYCKGFRIS